MGKSARQVYKSGKIGQFDVDCCWEVVKNLYDKNLAEAFFIGMGWVEGYNYCRDETYFRGNFQNFGNKIYSFWFASRFLD